MHTTGAWQQSAKHGPVIFRCVTEMRARPHAPAALWKAEGGGWGAHCVKHCPTSWLSTVSGEKLSSAARPARAFRKAPGAAARLNTSSASSPGPKSSSPLSAGSSGHEHSSCPMPGGPQPEAQRSANQQSGSASSC